MEHEKLNFLHRDDSIFAGAIFMSNRETKLECLQRKLFGLPHSKARFLKQVKSGMILFLFEHEERKLYGVFEAISDGAFNIIPDAFRSTGQSYPAQILFKRIWMCKPLCEDEFCSAIGENYYSANKFHFGLSYGQVIKLTHLFYSRKINIKQYQRHRIPNKILEKFENSAVDEVRLTETGTYFNCESDEYSREGKREVRRQHALPQASFDPSMHHKRYPTSMQHTVANNGKGSNQVNLPTFGSQLSDPLLSYSETLNSQSSSIFFPHDSIALHHFPIGKQSSTTSEIDYKPLLQHSSTNLDNMVSYLMGAHHHSSPVRVAYKLPCNNHNMIPRMVKIQEADEFTPLHFVNGVGPQTEVVQHTRPSGAQPNRGFEFPDYIPFLEESQLKLVNKENQSSVLENSEYIPSAALNSYFSSTFKENSKAFCSSDGSYDDDDDLKTYQRMQGDEYNVVSGRHHADSDLIRTSVFSRLSRDPTDCNHKTPEPSSSEPSSGLSFDQLLNILAARRKWWSSAKVSEQSMEWGSNEQYDCTALTGLFDQSTGHQNKIRQLRVQPVETSKKNDQYEEGLTETEHVGFTAPLDSDQSNNVVAEESFKLPFYNFRRRNMSQKYDSNKYGDICGTEATPMKSKRRKIVRPLLSGEMHQNVKGEEVKMSAAQLKEQTEVKVSAQTILEFKNESKANGEGSVLDSDVPGCSRIYEPEGESVEQNHATYIDGSDDYIPLE